MLVWAPRVALVVKNLPANAGNSRDAGSIPGLRRSLGEGNGNPLQYSCLGFLGHRSLAGDSPWCLKESDTTEGLATHAGSQCWRERTGRQPFLQGNPCLPLPGSLCLAHFVLPPLPFSVHLLFSSLLTQLPSPLPIFPPAHLCPSHFRSGCPVARLSSLSPSLPTVNGGS